MNYKILNFQVMGDDRGCLISLEEQKNIPFIIKRVYYIYNTKADVVRGNHAHPHLQQVVVCVSGSCKFVLNDGNNKECIELNSPNKGLYIGENIWREMKDFSPNCVLMVLANDFYNENEYIRDYENFLKIVNQK